MHIVYTMGAPQALWLAVVLVLVSWVTVGQAQHLVIGLDHKIDIDDAGKQVPRPPGKEAVVIVDIAHREAPRIVGTLPLMNSLLGPPTNLAMAVLINGSAAAKNAWYYRKGALAVLAIDGTSVA